MERDIRGDRVAVLISPGFGSGWFSNHGREELLFDPSIVAWVEAEEFDKVRNYMTLKYPEVYLGGVVDLRVVWIKIGTKFRIEEYDGSETLIREKDDTWFVA
jgi:hypothetical protein